MSKNTVDAIVAKVAHNIQLPTVTARPVIEKKSGRRFIVQEPLIEEPRVAFVSKKSSMAKAETQGMVGTGDFRNNMKAFIVEPGRKAEVFQKATQAPPAVTTSSLEDDYDVYLPDVTNLNNSISKVSNLIKDYITIKDVFGQVKNGIHDKKIFENIFYRKIQNCVYHSLREFCGIIKADDNTDILPVVAGEMDNISTLIFFDRIFNHKAVSFEKDPNKVMEKYRSTFDDSDGIQYGWLDIFRARVKIKLSLDDSIIRKIEMIIMEEWGCQHSSVQIPVSPENVTKIQTMIGNTKAAEVDEEEDDDMYDIEEEYDESYLSVSIIREEDIDIVKIESSDGYGKVIIPFYTNLGEIDMNSPIPSIVDPRNDKWDWLVHFVPDLMFRTRNPEKYLAGNDDLPEESKIRFVIMDETQEGEYIIGVYFVSNITLYDREEGIEDFSDDTVNMINKLVNMEVATGHMSHLNRSVSDTLLFRDEEYILNHVMGDDEDDEDDESDDCCDHDEDALSQAIDDVPALTKVLDNYSDLATMAALSVMNATPVEIPTEEYQQMDPDVVTVGGQTFPMEEEFTFQPIGKKQRLER